MIKKGESAKERTRVKYKIVPLFFVIILLVLVLIGVLVLSKLSFVADNTSPDIQVDQVLLKVLLNDGESLLRELRVMNTGDEVQSVVLSDNFGEMLTLSEESFELDPGQTKVVDLGFRSIIDEKNIEYSPGIYIGSVTVENFGVVQTVPVVVEVESSEVLFDMNINFPDNELEKGEDVGVVVRLYNLMGSDAMSINMDYIVRDLEGNTLFTESETVVVDSQVSFTKSISIPENFKTGTYVFAATANYAGSTGTTSYLFEVIDNIPIESISSGGFCSWGNPTCWLLFMILALLVLFILAYIIFFFRVYLKNIFVERPRIVYQRAVGKVQSTKKNHSLIYFLVGVMFVLIIILIFYLGNKGMFVDTQGLVSSLPIQFYIVIIALIVVLVVSVSLHHSTKSLVNLRKIFIDVKKKRLEAQILKVKKEKELHQLLERKRTFEQKLKERQQKARSQGFFNFLHMFGLVKTKLDLKKEVEREKRIVREEFKAEILAAKEKEALKLKKKKIRNKFFFNIFHKFGLVKTRYDLENQSKAEKAEEARKQRLAKEKEDLKVERTKARKKFFFNIFHKIGLVKTKYDLEKQSKAAKAEEARKQRLAKEKEDLKVERTKARKKFFFNIFHKLGLVKTKYELEKQSKAAKAEEARKQRLAKEKEALKVERKKARKKFFFNIFHKIGLVKTRYDLEKQSKAAKAEEARKQRLAKEKEALKVEKKGRLNKLIKKVGKALNSIEIGFVSGIKKKIKSFGRWKKERAEEKEKLAEKRFRELKEQERLKEKEAEKVRSLKLKEEKELSKLKIERVRERCKVWNKRKKVVSDYVRKILSYPKKEVKILKRLYSDWEKDREQRKKEKAKELAEKEKLAELKKIAEQEQELKSELSREKLREEEKAEQKKREEVAEREEEKEEQIHAKEAARFRFRQEKEQAKDEKRRIKEGRKRAKEEEELRKRQEKEDALKRKEEEKKAKEEEEKRRREQERLEKEKEEERKHRKEEWDKLKEDVKKPIVGVLESVKESYASYLKRKRQELLKRKQEEKERRVIETKEQEMFKQQEQKLHQLEEKFEHKKEEDMIRLERMQVKLDADEYKFKKEMELERESLLRKSKRSWFGNLRKNIDNLTKKRKQVGRQRAIQENFHRRQAELKKQRLQNKISDEDKEIKSLRERLKLFKKKK